jgi:hypothetical protein
LKKEHPIRHHPSQVWFNLVQWFQRKEDLNVNVYDIHQVMAKVQARRTKKQNKTFDD